jgi:hypothetical protein
MPGRRRSAQNYNRGNDVVKRSDDKKKKKRKARGNKKDEGDEGPEAGGCVFRGPSILPSLLLPFVFRPSSGRTLAVCKFRAKFPALRIPFLAFPSNLQSHFQTVC